ncbi:MULTISPECIES: carboxymuconolactone decarboxylase family protein [Albidovulum]|uniref:Carboxymuconolactone decarboxylase family protein n=2 Tax=Albidovulum TaxID=205889 RepID=A0ABT2Z5D6_9RHOB|nr:MULTISPECIES: carboxymuconolactone decarboxylase family protein [unclassified Defluviimonas]MCV2866212.1 carboxymuconolactone decarboxylase family protein [Defluviimonas sp. WL0075]MCV2867947.1 carboxymuconolactone decarboxylase family protein [Defluviimonas sp. WL0002]
MTRFTTAAFVFSTLLAVQPAIADDAEVKATLDDVQATFGGVPTFMASVSQAALPGLWKQYKELELSPDTALDPKTKALISLAVAAQIPCDYCIWADTESAHAAGATDQEIAEAVAMAGMTRNWSTIFHGMQVDFETFRKELGGS